MRVCCPVFSKKKETLALYITLPHWVYSHGCRGGCHPACHTHTQPTHRVNTGRPNPWNGRDQPDPSQWDEPDQPDPNPWGGCYLQAADPTQTHRPRPIPASDRCAGAWLCGPKSAWSRQPPMRPVASAPAKKARDSSLNMVLDKTAFYELP